jgi:hypothetical protein
MSSVAARRGVSTLCTFLVLRHDTLRIRAFCCTLFRSRIRQRRCVHEGNAARTGRQVPRRVESTFMPIVCDADGCTETCAVVVQPGQVPGGAASAQIIFPQVAHGPPSCGPRMNAPVIHALRTASSRRLRPSFHAGGLVRLVRQPPRPWASGLSVLNMCYSPLQSCVNNGGSVGALAQQGVRTVRRS